MFTTTHCNQIATALIRSENATREQVESLEMPGAAPQKWVDAAVKLFGWRPMVDACKELRLSICEHCASASILSLAQEGEELCEACADQMAAEI